MEKDDSVLSPISPLPASASPVLAPTREDEEAKKARANEEDGGRLPQSKDDLVLHHEKRRHSRAVAAKRRHQNSGMGLRERLTKRSTRVQPGSQPTTQASSEHNTPRRVTLNDLPANLERGFCSNIIITSKYTKFNFLFRNLFEQFRRVANTYFLAIAIMQSFSIISPVNPITSILPLVLVLSISAGKEAVEDYHRHQSDQDINNRKTQILRGERFYSSCWGNIEVGDILKLKNKQQFPADVLLLSTSEAGGICYIETMNLDGETNLKIRQSIPDVNKIVRSGKDCAKLKGEVQMEHPNPELYAFEGSLHLQNTKRKYPIDLKQTVLRGCILKNTKWAYALVLNTGHDTKLMMNSTETPSKLSHVERLMNRMILLIFGFLFSLCVVCGILSGVWLAQNAGTATYLRLPATLDVAAEGALSVLTFIILFNVMVPISLYVTMEMVKVGHALMMNSDLDMYDEESDTPAKARTSNLSEELGQVDYVFSDKTGTLTRNIMEFACCSVNSVPYFFDVMHGGAGSPVLPFDGAILAKASRVQQGEEGTTTNSNNTAEAAQRMHDFLFLLATSHTVVPETDEEGALVYQASSPDEAALVEAAAKAGFKFVARSPTTVTVEVHGEEMDMELLNVLEFNSTRKRMSVIVRMPDGTLQLLCKGADNVIMERLAPTDDNEAQMDTVTRHLELFANEGLRTLCLANRTLSTEEYEAWNAAYLEASLSLENRAARMEEQADIIERKLNLLGATAIEDKLQEGVPDAIYKLRQAGVKVWLLTGDKQGTAINIGYSSRLLDSSVRPVLLAGGNTHEVRAELDNAFRIINGRSPVGSSSHRLTSGNTSTTPTQQQQQQGKEPRRHTLTSTVHTSTRSDGDDGIGKVGGPPALLQSVSSGMTLTSVHSVDDGGVGTHEATTMRSNSTGVLGVKETKSHGEEMMDEDDNSRTPTPRRGDYRNNSSSSSGSSGSSGNTGRDDRELGLIVGGRTLSVVMENESLKEPFLQLSLQCKVVLCCRVSPLQKSEIVSMVKDNTSAITLAIGDGANDVSMITTAHIGVGISGQEGMQAVLASDYAIAQFRFLVQLMLIHGRYSYQRVTFLILYSFYKNMTLSMTQFWFAFFSGFSGQTLYDSWVLPMYNVIFTSLPVIAVAMFDRDIEKHTVLRYPRVFASGQGDVHFNTRTFVAWLLNGIWCSCVVFMCHYAVGTVPKAAGDHGLWEMGVGSFTTVIIVVNIYLALQVNTWTWYTVAATVGSVVAWLLYLTVYSAVGILLDDKNMYYVGYQWFSTPANYLTIVLAVVIAMLPTWLYKSYQTLYNPTPATILREREYMERHGMLADDLTGDEEAVAAKMMQHADGLDRTRSRISFRTAARMVTQVMVLRNMSTMVEKHRGYSFSQDTGTAELMTQELRNVTLSDAEDEDEEEWDVDEAFVEDLDDDDDDATGGMLQSVGSEEEEEE